MALTFNGKEVNTVKFNNNVGYTVVGSPTIIDGVVSGFSADDYVRTAKNFPTSNISTLEWGCKFTTGSNVNYQGITGTGSYWGCYGFRLNDYGALVITLSFSPTIEINFPANTIKSNSTYISKAYWNATTKEFSAKVSGDNGETWTTSSMVVSDDFSYLGIPVQFGRTQAGNFRGSIDLNETYIKVNDITWFNGKQQASPVVNEVYLNRNVGYTVVGSPTIVDGVVSGLSNSDYLQVFNFEQYKPFEFVLKIYTGTRQSDTCYLIRSNGLLLYWIWNYKLAFFLRNTDNQQIEMNGVTQLLANTNYWVKMQYDGQTMYLYLSTDGINYSLENSTTINVITNSYITKIGEQKSSGAIFNGSIDLNETYIKINGVTWFNGKQTATTPVWTRSV